MLDIEGLTRGKNSDSLRNIGLGSVCGRVFDLETVKSRGSTGRAGDTETVGSSRSQW